MMLHMPLFEGIKISKLTLKDQKKIQECIFKLEPCMKMKGTVFILYISAETPEKTVQTQIRAQFFKTNQVVSESDI